MNLSAWVGTVRSAYEAAGEALSSSTETLLLLEFAAKDLGEQEVEDLRRCLDLVMRDFLRRAESGATYGSVERIREQFGRSLEENYGSTDGPFLRMARAYWTLKVELEDLLPGDHAKALTQTLLKVELDVAAAFFPTPGPMRVSGKRRRAMQRELLGRYGSTIDIDALQRGNPILQADDAGGGGGCLGVLVMLLLGVLGLYSALANVGR